MKKCINSIIRSSIRSPPAQLSSTKNNRVRPSPRKKSSRRDTTQEEEEEEEEKDFVGALVKNDAVFYRNMKNQVKKTKQTDEKFKDLGKKRAAAEADAKKRASATTQETIENPGELSKKSTSYKVEPFVKMILQELDNFLPFFALLRPGW